MTFFLPWKEINRKFTSPPEFPRKLRLLHSPPVPPNRDPVGPPLSRLRKKKKPADGRTSPKVCGENKPVFQRPVCWDFMTGRLRGGRRSLPNGVTDVMDGLQRSKVSQRRPRSHTSWGSDKSHVWNWRAGRQIFFFFARRKEKKNWHLLEHLQAVRSFRKEGWGGGCRRRLSTVSSAFTTIEFWSCMAITSRW